MKNFLVFVSLFTLAVAFSGCDDEMATESTSTNETPVVESQEEAIPVATEMVMETEEQAAVPVVPAAPIDPQAVVVTVNDVKITEGQIGEEMEKRLAAQKTRMPAGTEIPEQQRQMLRLSIVDMMVEQELIKQKLAEKKITVTDEQATEEIKTIASQRNQTLEDVEKEIEQYGMTLADLKEQIRLKLQVDVLMEAEMGSDAVTDEDVKKFYDENPQHFNKPEQVKASHILCGKRGITEEEFPAELEKIKAAQARLKAGETFEDVAKECSTCPSAAKGGDLGFFGKGQMDPAFEKVAFELDVAQTSDIVKTSFGYHIIKVTEKQEGGATPLEEVKEQITQYLKQQKQGTFWKEYNQAMKDAATIEYSEAEKAAKEEAEKLQQQMMQQQMMQQIQAQMQQPQAQPAEAVVEAATEAVAPEEPK